MPKTLDRWIRTLSIGICIFTVQNGFAAPVLPCDPKNSSPPFPRIDLKQVAEGLAEPLGIVHAGDGSRNIFIIEQPGTIRVLKNGVLSGKPFLDIRGRVTSGGEKGLLGLAFHPEYLKNRLFFVNYTSPKGGLHTVISEFKAGDSSQAADPKSERILLTVAQPYANHNGGNLAFGPDGYLYIGMGDGGSGNDPHDNGQNLSTMLGKMLRIDVNRKEKEKAYAIPRDNPFIDKKNAAPEIWAYGLRNPWRFSFDAATGQLYTGDVGQNAREEIDVIQKGKNYGWKMMEGAICTPGVNPNCNKAGLELPIYDYPRSEGSTVIGGYVYRGRSLPSLCGAYIYGDFGNGRIWAFRYDGKLATDHVLLFESRRNISSFGEDEEHELYVADHDGKILKIVPGRSP
jgi:glucose/arabinose dehydrogenase